MKAKELGNVLANRLKTKEAGGEGFNTVGEPEAPEAPEAEGGITIPVSQLGDVEEGDIIQLEVVSVNGDEVSLRKVEGEAPEETEAPFNAEEGE